MSVEARRRRFDFEGVNLARGPGDFRCGIVPGEFLESCRRYLDLFVRGQATATAEEVGFGWVGRPEAPDTYEGLLATYEQSVASGQPLPVSDQHCLDTIYSTLDGNLACRFWHDCAHVRRGRGFSTAAELDMALWQLGQLEAVGLPRKSVPWWLLYSDTVGQTLHASALGRFPDNQWQFAVDVLTFGVEDAIVLAAKLEPAAELSVNTSG